MQKVVAILLISAALIAADCELSNYNGEPGCHTQEELSRVLYANFWDPTQYWRCVELNVPAVSERCADGTAFSSSLRACIKWFDWVWEPKVLPPSCPNQFTNNELQVESVTHNSK